MHLGQQPTLALADPSELSFAHMVDRLLVGWGDPLHRGLIIRLMSLVATVLTRWVQVQVQVQVQVHHLTPQEP